MTISVQVGYSAGIKESVDQLVEMEKVGADLVWVAEAYGIDAVSVMGYIAARTERIKIGAGILPLYTRTPALIAMSAAGVDYLSGGRCVLGLGASGPQVIEGWHGVPYDKPIARTREIVDICRQAWRRERLEHEGACYTLPLPAERGTGLGKPLKMIFHPVRDRIPIYVAALGPKNVEMAAQVAEGWLPIMFVPEHLSEFTPLLEEGAARAGRSLDGFMIAPSVNFLVSDDEEAARNMVRPFLALYVGGMGSREKNFYNQLVQRYGFEEAAKEVQDLYLDGKREEAMAALPPELIDTVALVGPKDKVRDRLAAYRDAGVGTMVITPLTEPQNRSRMLTDLAELV
ncbi:MAG: LLM class F420-dependent oxidoreductase [Actinomycetota bacterium]|nr:LLM class F420-dependent oxidoreductase [Actinomycetota bacterium]